MTKSRDVDREPPEGPAEGSIGETLLRIRKEKGLSLRRLASETGFSPSFLSQVENGQASPSIASLGKLARALGLRLVDFFAIVAAGVPEIMRAADRQALTSQWSKARFEPLIPRGVLRAMDGLVVTLAPGGRNGSVPEPRDTDQIVMVLAGAIQLVLEGKSFELEAGDAAAVPAGTAHRWENTSEDEARIALVAAVAPPKKPMRQRSKSAPARARSLKRGDGSDA